MKLPFEMKVRAVSFRKVSKTPQRFAAPT